jgi:hypothetical protein
LGSAADALDEEVTDPHSPVHGRKALSEALLDYEEAVFNKVLFD